MKKNHRHFIFPVLALLILFVFSCTKKDKTTPEPGPNLPGVLQGKVLNEFNQVLTGVQLTIQGNGINKSKITNNGQYKFDSLLAGSYNVTVKRNGYIDLTEAISITAGDTLTKDFTLKAGTAYFYLLSDSVITTGAYAKTFKIKVSSNTRWVVNSMADWLIPEQPGSSGDDSITVRVNASSLDTARQGKLVLQAGTIVKHIGIKQLANVKLQTVTPKPGNNATNTRDSVILLFNQPVSIVSNFPGYSNCQSEIRYSHVGNKVTFSYACAAIGGEYPFTITTLNSIGDQYTFAFKVSFYEKAIDITGAIRGYFVNDADNSYWLLTDHPNALYKIDMTSMDILHRYDLPKEAALFTVNPYNDKIYLSYTREPKLYIMNQNGTTEQVIDIVRDSTRGLYEYDGPLVNPVKLSFTKSGKGMIWLSNKVGYDAFYYWFIDAANNHRIWYESLPGDFTYYANARANYDQSKLILTYANSDPTIGIFDPQLMRFSSYKPTNMSGNEGASVIPSRKNGYVYSNGLYQQRIVDPVSVYETSTSRKYLPTFAAIDFCYQPGREKSIYFALDGKIEVIDYSAAATSRVVYDALYYMQGLAATLNGKHIIVSRHDGNYNSKVFQVPAVWFEY
jgi:hypothetical protein